MRKQRLEARVLNLDGLVANRGEMAGHALGDAVDMHSDLAPDLRSARVDPTQAEVTLLIARDAMPCGGVVTVATENVTVEAGDEALYKGVLPGTYLEISVTDTGTGIPASVMDRVMEPFFTTKSEGKGTGLGLAMVYGFAKQSGGTVLISSEVGRGTTVRLLFPAVEAEAEERPMPTGRPFTLHGDETILKVDDRRDVAAAAILLGFGYRVPVVDGPRRRSTCSTAASVSICCSPIW